MAKRFNRKKAAKDKAAHQPVDDAQKSEVPETYRHILDVSTLDAKFAESPTIGIFMSWVQRRIAASEESRPEERIIDCHNPRSCPDNTYHTYRQFENCIQDRGDTIADARRIWFGKLQFNNRWHMSDEREIHPVPLAHAIDCGFSECPSNGMHTVGGFIGCVTSAGRPLDAAIRIWNGHVAKSEQVPLGSISTPAAAPIEPAAPTEPAAVPTENAALPHREPDPRRDPEPNPPKVDVNTTDPWPSELVGQTAGGNQALDIIKADIVDAYKGRSSTIKENRRRNAALEERLKLAAEKDKAATTERQNVFGNKERETAADRLGMSSLYAPQDDDKPEPTLEYLVDADHIEEQQMLSSNVYFRAYQRGDMDDVYSLDGMELVGHGSSDITCGTPLPFADPTHGKNSPFKWFKCKCKKSACHECGEGVNSDRAFKTATAFMAYKAAQGLNLIDGNNTMLRHTTFSFSAEHIIECRDPIARQRHRRRSDRIMREIGLRFGVVFDHYLRMYEDLKGGYPSYHRHYIGPLYIDLSKYEAAFALQIAEWERYQALVEKGSADPEPLQGPARLSFRRRFARTGIMKANPKRHVRRWKHNTKRVQFPGPAAKLWRRPDGYKYQKPVCPGARNITLDSLDIVDHIGRPVPTRPGTKSNKKRTMPDPTANFWGRLIMMAPHPVTQINDITGDVIHVIEYKMGDKLVYLDSLDAIYRVVKYPGTHAHFEVGPNRRGPVMRHVGKKPPIRKIIARVNDSNLLTVLQPRIHKQYFETPDKKRYPDARLKEVTIHDIQTGQSSLSLVRFKDIMSASKGVTMSAAQFRKHVHNKIMAPQDVGVRPTAEKCGRKAHLAVVRTPPVAGCPSCNAPAPVPVSSKLHFPRKGPPDHNLRPQSWQGPRDEISMSLIIAYWYIPEGTHVDRHGKTVKHPSKPMKTFLTIYWETSRQVLCPKCGVTLVRVLPVDELEDHLIFNGEYGTEFLYCDGDKLQVYDPKEHLFEGNPIIYEGSKRPEWKQNCKVPNPRLDTMPASASMTFRTEQEIMIAKAAVKDIISDEFPSSVPGFKDLRRERRRELKHIAERYLMKYGIPEIKAGWMKNLRNGILHMEESEKKAAGRFADAAAKGQTQIK